MIRQGLLAGLLLAAPAAAPPAPSPAPPRDVPARLIGAAVAEGRAYERLAWLSDRIGPRPAGGPALDRALDWAESVLRADGITAIARDPVEVPHWERGPEEVRIVAPAAHPVAALGLGGTVATGPEGIEAEVVEVDSFEALRALDDAAVRGRIVLYNRPIYADPARKSGYGDASPLRVDGAVEAARRGAVGTLVRSLGTADYRLPHTGMMRYQDGVPRIPSAAVSAEDADLIHRLLQSGEPVRVRMTLLNTQHPPGRSANLVADLPGREKPGEIVLVAAHLDSWDVGTGATDDGVGVAMVLETMRLLRALPVPPRRTVRAVLFTAEEIGILGGKAYARDRRDELARHVAAVEADAGAGRVLGFGVVAGEGGVEAVRRAAAPLAGLGSGEVVAGGGGADISALIDAGVPQVGVRHDTSRYFDWHHSPADTLDKVDAGELARSAAALAVLTWGLAEATDAPARIPPPTTPGPP